jgi:hypothetical protein
VGPGGEQVRKGEGLAVDGQQYRAGWEGCQVIECQLHRTWEERARKGGRNNVSLDTK